MTNSAADAIQLMEGGREGERSGGSQMLANTVPFFNNSIIAALMSMGAVAEEDCNGYYTACWQ